MNEGPPLLPGPPFVTDTFVLTDLTNSQVNRGSYRVFDPPAGIAGGGTDPDRFNFRAFTPAIPPIEIQNLYASARYKIFGEGLQVYGDVSYGHSKQDNGLAPAPFQHWRRRGQTESLQSVLYRPVGGAPTATNADDQLRSVSYRLVQELGNRRRSSTWSTIVHRRLQRQLRHQGQPVHQ
jgi:hypothetical protein